MNPKEGELSIEFEKLELERRRIELEEKKHTDTISLEERKIKSERSTKLLTQFSIFVPLIIFLLGFSLNSCSEARSRELLREAEIRKQRREFIDRQLAELYYPVKMRFQKDNAVWKLWNENQRSDANGKLAQQIERDYLLPNHEKNVEIIDSHFNLLKNDFESEDISKLIELINQYERHVALYKALRETGDKRNPIDFGKENEYPRELSNVIEGRIKSLEAQGKSLMP